MRRKKRTSRPTRIRFFAGRHITLGALTVDVRESRKTSVRVNFNKKGVSNEQEYDLDQFENRI